MKRNRYDFIINISSTAAKEKGKLTGIEYTSAKAGVLGPTKWLAVDLGPFNICVNAIAPGIIISGVRIKNCYWRGPKKQNVREW